MPVPVVRFSCAAATGRVGQRQQRELSRTVRRQVVVGYQEVGERSMCGREWQPGWRGRRRRRRRAQGLPPVQQRRAQRVLRALHAAPPVCERIRGCQAPGRGSGERAHRRHAARGPVHPCTPDLRCNLALTHGAGDGQGGHEGQEDLAAHGGPAVGLRVRAAGVGRGWMAPCTAGQQGNGVLEGRGPLIKRRSD